MSALRIAGGSLGILAGTWDGRVVSLREADGSTAWTTALEDGISVVSATADSAACFVGSYGGHLARLGARGEKEWIRDTRAGVVHIVVLDREDDIVVATRQGVLTRLRAQTQSMLWEHFFESGLVDIAFSRNRRRAAVALRSGKVQVCGIEGVVHVRAEAELEGLRQCVFSPLSPAGRLLLIVSRRHGLALLDDQSTGFGVEVEPPVLGVSLADDGRSALVARPNEIELLRAAAPNLTAKLVPLGELRNGRFTRLRVTIQNLGERPARDAKVEFIGPWNARPFALNDELGPGATSTREDPSVQPVEDGALPIKVRMTCIDDYGIEHAFEAEQVLDVALLAGKPEVSR